MSLIAPTNKQIKNQAFQRRLWIIIKNLKQPRRRLLDNIVEAFRDYSGEMHYPDGQPYDLPMDLDAVFGDDPDFRWISVYLEADETGQGPKRLSKKYERLRILALYAQIIFDKAKIHLELETPPTS